MQYLQHQLDNGLQILAECHPDSHAMACGFFVRTGARDELPSMVGISHFLEHMVFKGTPNRTAEEVNRELDEMGSHSNAQTGEESTIYYARVLPDFQTPIVALLSDIMRPSLREDDFATEKNVIIEEIMMYDDQPPYGGHERIMRDFFGDHPLGQCVQGTVDTVSNLTPEQMRDYFQVRYSPANICLAAAGNVDFDRLVADCEQYCSDWKKFDAPRDAAPAAYRSGFDVMHKPESTQEYLLQLTQGPSSRDEDRFAARVLTTILGDDSGSRMYWEFLDSGRAEAAGMGNHEYDDAGLVMTFICCAPDEAQSNLERLRDLQANALTNPVTQKELDQAKRKISSHIILSSERSDSRMFSVGAQWLKNHEFKSPAEIAATYEAITLDQVHAVAKKYPLTENMTLCVGPESSLAVPA
ncbi:MAG: M16 family metallopeptidase [Pirellulaceae bacterium]